MRRPTVAEFQIAAGALALGICAGATLAAKWWFYPGSTWHGFATDLKVMVGFGGAAISVAAWFFTVYRNESLDETVQAQARAALLSARLPGLVALLLATLTILVTALATVGERQVAPEVLTFADHSNWEHAHEALSTIEKDSIRPDILRTFQIYVRVHEASERDELRQSITLRDDRNAVLELLNHKHDYEFLNTLSFAEVSKAIFFVEAGSPAQETIGAAIARLKTAATFARSDDLARLTARIGALYLASKSYGNARTALEKALQLERNATRRARVQTMLGNAFAADPASRDLIHAAELYRAAEADYPEGNRFIFYSNFAYLLMLSKNYAEAQGMADRAIQIAPKDWVSYMNRGLIREKLEQYEDAYADYQIVIANSREPDALREARILGGRCLEIGGRDVRDALALYLAADGRSTTKASVDRVAASGAERSKLYSAMAVHLKNLNTHGIEPYVEWFNAKATVNAPASTVELARH